MTFVENTKSKQPALIFIFFTILIDMMGIGIIIPIMPKLITTLTGQELSDAALTGGGLIFAYALFQFLFAPVMGELSDHFGRKPVLMLALFGLGIDFFIHAFSPTITWLFLGRVVAGIFGASHTVATAYVADISTKEDKAKNFGIIGAAFGLGFVIGPGVGGIVSEFWGVKAPFFVAGGLSLLNLLMGLLLIKESLPPEKRRKIEFAKMLPFVSFVHMKKYRGVIGFVIAFSLVNLAGQVMPSTWSFFTIEKFNWTEWEVAVSLMVVGLLVSAVQGFLTGKLVKKYGNRKVIITGFTLWTIGMFAIALSGNQIYLYAAVVPYILGGIAGPTLQGLTSDQVSDKEQGNLQGVLTSLVSLAAIPAPLMYTAIFSVYTGDDTGIYFPGVPYVLGAVILIIATIVVIYSLKNLNNEPNKENELEYEEA